MTEDEKYEIAVLATDLDEKRRAYDAHAMMNTPTDPVEREKSMIAYQLVVTEYMEAHAALRRAQFRIANKAEP